MRIVVLFILIVGIVYPNGLVLGQINSNFTKNDTSISLDPAYPQPGEVFTASLNDYSVGFFGSSITWTVNGIKLNKASNKRSIKLVAPPAGKTQKIQVVLNNPNSGEKVVTKIINPVYLDVIIEPQTHTPHFYKGRALPSIDSIVNATALVSGAEGVVDHDLVYTWRLNRKTLGGGPLRGGNKISFPAPIGSDAILRVQVSRPDGTVVAQRSFLIPIVEPEIRFYSVSPLLGVNKIAISDALSIQNNILSIQAEPYNLDLRVYNNPGFTQWYINRKKVSNNNSNPYFITIKRNQAGQMSTLGFEVRDLNQVLQGAKSSVNIKF